MTADDSVLDAPPIILGELVRLLETRHGVNWSQAVREVAGLFAVSAETVEEWWAFETCDDDSPSAAEMIAAKRAVAAASSGGEPAATATDDAKLLNELRTAMRSIGSHYHLVQAAADRAAKAGHTDRADRLEHVYGRLYWMDHALGTLKERVEADDRKRKPSPVSESATAPTKARCGEHVTSAKGLHICVLAKGHDGNHASYDEAQLYEWPAASAPERPETTPQVCPAVGMIPTCHTCYPLDVPAPSRSGETTPVEPRCVCGDEKRNHIGGRCLGSAGGFCPTNCREFRARSGETPDVEGLLKDANEWCHDLYEDGKETQAGFIDRLAAALRSSREAEQQSFIALARRNDELAVTRDELQRVRELWNRMANNSHFSFEFEDGAAWICWYDGVLAANGQEDLEDCARAAWERVWGDGGTMRLEFAEKLAATRAKREQRAALQQADAAQSVLSALREQAVRLPMWAPAVGLSGEANIVRVEMAPAPAGVIGYVHRDEFLEVFDSAIRQASHPEEKK